jgi:hypothetical protein
VSSTEDYQYTASGLGILMLSDGDGASPDPGQKVSIHYTGWLEDGTRFDSSVDKGAPFAFVLGRGEVIPGMDEGVAAMRVGERRRFRIPPELGYGRGGAGGVIPPDATLIFEVELLELGDAEPGTQAAFPFNAFSDRLMEGELGTLIRELRPHFMLPPYPWGHWLYGRIFETVVAKLEGDVIELGVGKGGTSLFFGHLARPVGKRVYSFDSFEGLPDRVTGKDNPYFRKGDYRPSPRIQLNLLQRLHYLARQYDLEDTIQPVKGFFADTVPTIPEQQRFCLAHLDSDLYDSVHVSLEGIYDKVVEGGAIILDDFFHPAQGPARAAADFFNARGVLPVYHVSFPYSVVVFKGESADPATVHRALDGNVYSLAWLRDDDTLLRTLEGCLDAPGGEDCRMLLELLRSESRGARDIYSYWRSLETFWDRISIPAPTTVEI